MTRPVTLAEVAQRRHADPPKPLWKPLGEFLDAFYDDGHDRAAMLAEEPTAVITVEEAAYLAASAEYLSSVYRLPHPTWVDAPAYVLRQAYWPEPLLGRAAEAIFLAESPTAFRRRFIFTEGRPLRRKGGPRFTPAS